ncbi:MAG TPA: GNAT family N-acetyltransferase [Kofleriaceae bacterium]|nr:GNAT family N-acetyltransferase [Kofleriaceae bacterium]
MPALADHVRLPRAWDTAAAALGACARALGDPRTAPELAAASGLAFRTSLDDAISLGGPHAYPWREELAQAAERLGCACVVEASHAPPGSALHAAALRRVRALIASGIDAGRPTVVWGIHAPEFGLVRGLDGDRLEVSGILDGMAPPELPLSELGRGDVPLLFALQLTARIDVPPAEAAHATLAAALTHGRGPAPTLAGVHTGLGAWQALIDALVSGVLDPAGLAYAAQRYAEARAAAAGWLDGAEAALAVPLTPARASFRRSAGMLAELAACHPFPPSPDTMLTNTHRDEAQALVGEVLQAESAGLDAIAAALAACSERRAGALTVVDLDEARLPSLFACAGELPLDLSAEAARCRDAERPRLGDGFRGKLLYDGTRLIGHLLYAPLAAARYPIGAEGTRWFVFCPWLARDARGRGLGKRLFDALLADARASGVDGLLTLATADERFLHPSGYARHGFTEIGRRGELRLLERALSDRPSCARLHELPVATRGGRLPVLVRQAYNCPLLVHTRDRLADAARAAGPRVHLDLADATAEAPAGAAISGKPLLHNYVPPAALAQALKDELERW